MLILVKTVAGRGWTGGAANRVKQPITITSFAKWPLQT